MTPLIARMISKIRASNKTPHDIAIIRDKAISEIDHENRIKVENKGLCKRLIYVILFLPSGDVYSNTPIE